MSEATQIKKAYTEADVMTVIEAMPQDMEQALHMSLMIFIVAAFDLDMPLHVVVSNVIKTFELMKLQAAEERQP